MIAQISGLNQVLAWTSYLDVYGFKSIVKATSNISAETPVFDRLKNIHSKLSSRLNKNTILFILSDNYFLINPVSQDPMAAYENCLADVRALIDLHVKSDLPLRGGIAFGPVSVGQNTLVGDPVIRAVTYERLSRVPLVLLPEREIEAANLSIKPPIFVNHAVTDEHNVAGIISSTFVVPQNARSFIEYCENKYRTHRINGPEKVAKDWLDTVRVLATVCGSTAATKV
jgi:hypothetical protein